MRRDRRAPEPRASTSSSPTTTASRRSCPPALAVVNPQRADSAYPDRRLAGSGVAFKIAQLLLADEPGGPAAALELADLATIGTVADVAPIVGENRAIARLGLDRLRTRAAAGDRGAAGRAPASRAARVDLETVAFALAPRLNAAGRVGEALDGRPPPARRGPRRRRPRSRRSSRRPTRRGAT